jgi:predicted nucleotidyltransferase
MSIDPRGLEAVFARHPVVAAYLFGSQATGTTTPLSDVDIAVLLAADTPAPGRVQAALISDLMLALRRSDIDVVVLNAAPPLLKDRALFRGRLIYCRDHIARVRFEVAARREYFDTQPLRDAQDRALLDRYAVER